MRVQATTEGEKVVRTAGRQPAGENVPKSSEFADIIRLKRILNLIQDDYDDTSVRTSCVRTITSVELKYQIYCPYTIQYGVVTGSGWG